jgi:hypothetical protein
MTDANDPIPLDAIALVDAYQIVWESITLISSELLEAINPAQSISDQANREAWAAYDSSQLKANIWLRQRIADKSLSALIRDPEQGEVLKLSHIGWEDPGFLNSGIHENFVGPDDIINPGPNTVLHGQRRPVFFKLDEFESLVRQQRETTPRSSLAKTAMASTHVIKRASVASVPREVKALIAKKPAAGSRDADQLAKSIGAPRPGVRSELRKQQSKQGRSVKVGRPRKTPLIPN